MPDFIPKFQQRIKFKKKKTTKKRKKKKKKKKELYKKNSCSCKNVHFQSESHVNKEKKFQNRLEGLL